MLDLALRPLFSWLAARVEQRARDPRRAQRQTFARLQRTLAGSEVARLSGFDRCRTLEDCRALPATDADTLAPLFSRVEALGRAAGPVFGRSPLMAFGRTSGTSGTPKLIPWTRAALKSLERTLVSMAICHIVTGNRGRFPLRGKRVLLSSRPICGTSSTGLPLCDVSGLIGTRVAWYGRFLYAPRHRDHFITDWPTKAERILDQIDGVRVHAIVGLPALLDDLVTRAKARHRVEQLDTLWPDLHEVVYGAWHLSEAQRHGLTTRWFGDGRRLRFFETYFATEALMGFSFRPDDDGLTPTLDEHLFLFAPIDGPGGLRFAHELETGARYAIHVTTPGGLIQYRMGDIIEVTSTDPLRIRVVGREVDELSLTGERITPSQIDLALDAAGCAPTGLDLPVVWVEHTPKPRLVWGLPHCSTSDSALATRLDDALCRFNVLYAEALRFEQVILPSRVVDVPPAVFATLRTQTLGQGQFKMKRLFASAEAFSMMTGHDVASARPATVP